MSESEALTTEELEKLRAQIIEGCEQILTEEIDKTFILQVLAFLELQDKR